MRMDSLIIIKVDGKQVIKRFCSEFCYVALPKNIECPFYIDCRRCNISKKVLFGKLVLEYATNHKWFGDGKYTLEIK
jgi:hypothetical protein